MDRRNFMKLVGVLPIVTMFKSQNTLGLSGGLETLSALSPGNVLRILEGVTPGQLIVIASRPSMGKSTVALNLLNELSIIKNQGCAYFSIETSKEALLKRVFLIAANVSKLVFESGTLTEADYQRLLRSSRAISKADLYINDDSKVSTESMALQIKELKKSGKNIKFVFVDYLNLLRMEHAHSSRRDEVTDILQALKAIAENENVIVVALAQLNRGMENRTVKRPTAADFRETKDLSAIDKLILLYRDDYYAHNVQASQSEIEFLMYGGHSKLATNYKGQLDKSTFRISEVSRF